MGSNGRAENALSLLEKALRTSCPEKRGDIIREFCVLANGFDQRSRLNLVSSSMLYDRLHQLISTFGLISEFTDREFTSYDKSDFKDYDVTAQALLTCTSTYLSLVKSQQYGDETHELEQEKEKVQNSTVLLDLEENKSQGDEESFHIIYSDARDYVLKILPKVLLLIGANIRNPVWSSEGCRVLSVELLKCIEDLFECRGFHDILSNCKFYQGKGELLKKKDENILGYLFYVFEKPLSRDRWEKNPFLCEVFNWLVPCLKTPSLSNHIDQIMATCLNFIHSHETLNKLNGLISLKHLIENTSGEELRWYNRVDVIYDTLKVQLYSKEELVLDSVLQCLFFIIRVLERNPVKNSDKHHEMLATLVRDTEMENLIIVRRVLISNLAKFIPDCGILCVQHLSNLLRVIENFLDVEDLPEEIARIQALQALENVLIVAWPRIHHHSKHILQFLLKFVINLETANMKETVKERLRFKTRACVKLLLKVNPSLLTDLEEVKQSKKLTLVKDFIKCVSNE